MGSQTSVTALVGDRRLIIGLGEILWDVFEDGKVLGGAPANFAYHANSLGERGVPLSRVGRDDLGDEILEVIGRLGMSTDYLQRDPDRPTGTVPVRLDSDGTPHFTIVEDVAWDYLEADEAWLALAARSQAVCFGTLAQRCPKSRATVYRVLAQAGQALKVCDINFRQHFYSREVVAESLAAASVLKLNDQEVTQLRELLAPGTKGDTDAFMRGLSADYGLELACITLGADGCRLISADEVVARPVPPVQVVDTVGSGDAFAAGLVVKYLEGGSLAAVADAANLLGAYVAGRRGATPALTAEVVEKLHAL